jgi:hypothetical protein
MKGVGFAQWEELSEEHLGTLSPSVDNFLVLVEPLFCLPQEGKGKQTEFY